MVDIKKEKFDPANKEHRQLVQDKTQKLKMSLQTLKANDKKAVVASISVLAAYIIPSFIPFRDTALVAATSFATCFCCWRSGHANKYNQALQEAKAIYDWCFKDARMAVRSHCVVELMKELAPLVPVSVIQKWQDDDLEAQKSGDGYLEKTMNMVASTYSKVAPNAYHSSLTDKVDDGRREELKALSDGKHLGTFDYRLYGESKGFSVDEIVHFAMGNLPFGMRHTVEQFFPTTVTA